MKRIHRRLYFVLVLLFAFAQTSFAATQCSTGWAYNANGHWFNTGVALCNYYAPLAYPQNPNHAWLQQGDNFGFCKTWKTDPNNFIGTGEILINNAPSTCDDDPPPPAKDPGICPLAGKPISAATHNEWYQIADFQSPSGLELRRTYISGQSQSGWGYLAAGWSLTAYSSHVITQNGIPFLVARPDGKVIPFTRQINGTQNIALPDADTNDRLSVTTDGSGNITSYFFTMP